MKSLIFLLLIATPLAAQSVTIPRSDAELNIDGALTEPVWQTAARLDGFYQYRPVDSRPAEDSTVVLLWYADDALHVGIMAYDRRPDQVRATNADRDNIGADDQVTIFVDTFNDKRRAYFFGVNPLGVQDDGTRSEGGFSTSGGGSGSTDRNPDYLWQSRGQLTAWGWSAEIRIPFKSLRWGGSGEQTWGFNVQRMTQRTGYEDTWTDVRRANASFLAQAGTITGIRDIRRGVVTEIQPTFVANAPGGRVGDRFERGDIKGELGANLRLGFTSLTLDATINPDFSQVESDVGLVTLNERFALFFPERRPFFLEGIDLFATPNNLVYTRTVANPLAGAKVTGKFGKWSLAHLSAVDEFSESGLMDEDSRALASITRVRRDVGENSVAGLTFTHRGEDEHNNQVIAADTRIVFGTVYYFAAQLGVSRTHIDGLSEGTDQSDPIWEMEVDRTGRAFGFNYKISAVGRDFDTWSGFVNRTDIVSGRAFNRYTAYGSRGALLEQFSVNGGLSRIWRYGNLLGDQALEGSQSVNLSVRLRGGWNLNGSGELGFVRFEENDYQGLQVAGTGGPVPFDPAPGAFDGLSGSFSIDTPTWQMWSGELRVEGGAVPIFPEAARGRQLSVRGSIDMRPIPAVRLDASLTLEQLTRQSDGSEFGRTILPRLKLEVQPNRALFFRVVGEYRSERQSALRDELSGQPLLLGGVPVGAQSGDRFRVDLLASYEPTPGTVAYLGYGSTLRGERPLTFRALERQEDAFFMKVSYLFRR